MVAKIKSGKSLIGALNYNEVKVKAGKAQLISANAYAKDLERLTFEDKLFRLKDLASRNLRTKTNTVHLSLNFDITEKLTEEILSQVAQSYMDRIGFGSQPYLVYQHQDAGHPHIHIVTTNIQADGQRISLHNIGKELSEPARKAIELEYGLVQADLNKKMNLEQGNNQIKALEYGLDDTKRAITNIVTEVLQHYKFTSLAEFNAVLNLYKVNADRGSKKSISYNKGGLRYWALDKNGKKCGVPIKASSIYRKPILKTLEGRFRLNEYLRRAFKEKVKSKIDKAISKATSKEQFLKELEKIGVTGVLRQNAEGRIYGLTYIDQQNKVVFNGSDIGKNYSAAAIISYLANTPALENRATGGNAPDQEREYLTANHIQFTGGLSRTVLDDLLSPTDQTGNENLFERRKKKKRKKLNL